MKASITYDVVTHESAEHGDHAEAGFYSPGGWKTEDRDETLTVGDVLRWAVGRGSWHNNGNGSFYTHEPDINYRTGEQTSYAVHFDGITAASLNRIARLLD